MNKNVKKCECNQQKRKEMRRKKKKHIEHKKIRQMFFFSFFLFHMISLSLGLSYRHCTRIEFLMWCVFFCVSFFFIFWNKFSVNTRVMPRDKCNWNAFELFFYFIVHYIEHHYSTFRYAPDKILCTH